MGDPCGIPVAMLYVGESPSDIRIVVERLLKKLAIQ